MRIGNKKGFTLIELMIVIAIIGILAITIVPQLTGAQARARDTGRIANIATTRAVLETYFGDAGEFPASPSATNCLSGAKGVLPDASSDLANLFKNGKAPVDPQAGNKSLPCDKANGSLGYKPLNKDGTQSAGYIITTNVETTKKANTDYSTSGFVGKLTNEATGNGEDYVSAQKIVGAFSSGTEPTAGADNSIYAEMY